MKNDERFIPIDRINKKISENISKYKVLYICAPIGYGKTTNVLNWINNKNKNYIYLSTAEDSIITQITNSTIGSNHIIVIDDINDITDEKTIEFLMGLISKLKNKFILIGDIKTVSWMKPYIITNQMIELNQIDLELKMEEFDMFLSHYNLFFDDNIKQLMLEETQGWIIKVLILLSKINNKTDINKELFLACQLDLYVYLDNLYFKTLDYKIRYNILCLAICKRFTYNMALAICNYEEKDNIKYTLKHTSIIEEVGEDVYEFTSEYYDFIKYKQKEIKSEEDIKNSYNNLGDYYYSNEDIINALECYRNGKNHSKIIEILKKNSVKHPGATYFVELQKYYLSIPHDLIEKSPELMSGLAMLHSICMRLEDSDYWYKKLKKFYISAKKDSKDYIIARERMLYLDIALPQKGVKNIKNLLLIWAKLLHNGGVNFQEFSISGNMPSLMNGGKDFCEWSKTDKMLYRLLKKPASIVLGKRAYGFADVAFAESQYEKSAVSEFIEILPYISVGLSNIQTGGSLEMQFAAYGVMARLYSAQGKIDIALTIIENLLQTVIEEKHYILAGNVKTFKIRLQLLLGNEKEAYKWLETEAPDENIEFNVLHRYRYLTKIRIYIQMGKYCEAISLANKLKVYYETFNRGYGIMECHLLLGIAYFRLENIEYISHINKALEFCQEYNFIRPIADMGLPIYLILKKFTPNIDNKLFKKIVKEARIQALQYYNYLAEDKTSIKELTKKEMLILKHISLGKSNGEIAEDLSISLSTVKFHTSNIYMKLNVKNRSGAIEVAKKNSLL